MTPKSGSVLPARSPARSAEPDQTMADLDISQNYDEVPRDEYSMIEVVFWIIGILCIPGVPIIMVYFLTPYSGM